MTDFDELHRAYRIAKAAFDSHSAFDYAPKDEPEGYQDELNRLSSITTRAMDALLMCPVGTQRELAEKLDIIVREEIYDGWHLCDEIFAILRIDGHRVLDRRRA
ncbi:hypothetical protein [Croceicoccus naphthovorans]|uniref:hypothetical protein n=1 Tax=Croceicoccus naphthovorans TaxID=1348774 RepID=UPI00069D264B|nr:hypothetical protein [Croceicoccus naphthovorans]MBB3990750.1 hypothetical protein [Croceicoccus naphthovorans]